MLLTCINNYYSQDNDGYLPADLCMMGLAHQLNKAAMACIKLVFPRTHNTDGGYHFDVPMPGSPHVYCMDAGGRDAGGRDRTPSRDDHGRCQSFPPRLFPPRQTWW